MHSTFYPEFCLRELPMLAMIDLKLDELETWNKLAVIWLLGHFHQIVIKVIKDEVIKNEVIKDANVATH